MVTVNFDKLDNVSDFKPLPDGDYQCQIGPIEEATSRNGNLMWKLKLKVTSGNYSGRIIRDQLMFTEGALPRVKQLYDAVGLDVGGTKDLVPNDLRGRECTVTVATEEYEDSTGFFRTRNKVPYSGYQPPVLSEAIDRNDMPF